MRLAVARDDGLDEDTAQKAFGSTEDLPSRHRTAIALADALMTQPGRLDPSLAAQILAELGRDEIIELTLDVMKWNYQKVMVALGTDPEVTPGELTDLVFDDDGRWVRTA